MNALTPMQTNYTMKMEVSQDQDGSPGSVTSKVTSSLLR